MDRAFKSGDKVRIVKNKSGFLGVEIGSIQIVSKDSLPGCGCWTEDDKWYFSPDEVEPVQPVDQVRPDFSYTVTPEMMYGENYKIPEGWEEIDFRPFFKGETFLTSQFLVPTVAGSDAFPDKPRFILRKKEPRRVIFEECGYDEALPTSNSSSYRLAINTTLGIPQFRSKEEKFEGFWLKKVEESK